MTNMTLSPFIRKKRLSLLTNPLYVSKQLTIAGKGDVHYNRPCRKRMQILLASELCVGLHHFVGMKRHPIRAMKNDSLPFHQVY